MANGKMFHIVLAVFGLIFSVIHFAGVPVSSFVGGLLFLSLCLYHTRLALQQD